MAFTGAGTRLESEDQADSLHRGGWDEEETERVRKIIEDAAEKIARRPE
ncbi:MAG: hypothetical protein ABW034_19515 [Steroidobacteraceae bacterium]